MKKKLITTWTVGDICKGFIYDKNEGKGLFGLNGQLIVQPEYQRNYIYDQNGDEKAIDVIRSLMDGYPLGLLYFVKRSDGKMEVLDGQQRITSFGRYINNTYPFAVHDEEGKPWYFGGLPDDVKKKILKTPMTVYVCEGEPSEIDKWFSKINIAGVPLNDQERLNASYHGSFVTLARKEYSNSGNANMNKWLTYIKGDPKRQDVLQEALRWVSHGNIKDYMANHRNDNNISELKGYFESVIDWAGSLFDYTGKYVRGLNWGELYEKYHITPYDKQKVNQRVEELLSDSFVRKPANIFEYILEGENHPEWLDIRVFDDNTKRIAYNQQTAKAKQDGVSNCPYCAMGHEANAKRIWKISEMDADHVTAWSKGGATDASNCQMLCKTHNRAKGNR